MEHVIFIFIDGCGVGPADAGNPFSLADSRNPVPLLARGRHGERLRRTIDSLSDVAPAILDIF